MTNLLTLPVANAKLPAVYERAKEALQKCSTLDECAEWKNKAEAVASYARQSEDESLFQMATRIKARAIRRCGQLLKEIEREKPGPKPERELGRGAPPQLTRAGAARNAGMSRDQQKQALRVAALPEREFDAAIERSKPATVTELAKRGTTKKPPSTAHLEGRDPKDFAKSTRAQGALKSFVAMTTEISAVVAVRGAVPSEFAAMRGNAKTVVGWIEKMLAELERGKS